MEAKTIQNHIENRARKKMRKKRPKRTTTIIDLVEGKWKGETFLGPMPQGRGRLSARRGLRLVVSRLFSAAGCKLEDPGEGQEEEVQEGQAP